MIDLFHVSIWPILISALINMFGGMLWYGPLFGRLWLKGIGLDPDDKEKIKKMQKGAAPGYAFSLLFALIFGYVIDLLFNTVLALHLAGAVVLTLLLYLGFTLANTAKAILWGELDRTVFVMNTGFELCYIGIMIFVAYFL